MASNSPLSQSPPPTPDAVVRLLRGWLSRRVAPEALRWLDAETDRLRGNGDERRLPIALGLAARKVGRSELGLDTGDCAAADRLRAGWQPQRWSTDEAARVLLLLSTHHDDDRAFAARVDRLCATAEVAEHVGILKGFAVLPAPTLLLGRAREGVRSSMQPVFEAIACRNPYPLDHFDAAAWNQMVVKCVFMGSPIEAVSGLGERRNPDLIQMLADLVAERRAAGRSVPQQVLDYIGS
ncbi:MAG: EboA domain-containing protein [Hyphomonadaceae bacterium]|nr:EboA domain-containing protein [Hyphomonadaceae bacterium]